jgi:hypothetical protein
MVVSIPFVRAEHGANLPGPLPLELQRCVVNSPGVGAAAKEANAARAFVNLLSKPGPVSVLEANGLEPAPPKEVGHSRPFPTDRSMENAKSKAATPARPSPD